jgi:hypothetical protein
MYCPHLLRVGLTCSLLTAMDSNTKFQLIIGFVSDNELCFDSLDQMQCHSSDLSCMSWTIAYRKTADHHVCVANRLHLPGRRSALEYKYNQTTALEKACKRSLYLLREHSTYFYRNIETDFRACFYGDNGVPSVTMETKESHALEFFRFELWRR